MGCLGVHFALDERAVEKLRAFGTDKGRLDFLIEELEEEYFREHEEWLAETDKAWDAIHRTLTDGGLGWDNGTYPLNHVIFGGERMYFGHDFIMVLKSPAQVRDAVRRLQDITEASFRTAYFRIDPDDYGMPVSEEDFAYTWSWFSSLREFFERAAAAGRHVLFSASQ